MKKTIGLVCRLLATGTITLFLAACYGVMMQWKRITVRSPENTAIQGIRVTLADGATRLGRALTDEAGNADFDPALGGADATKAVVEDVDGTANGGEFATREIALDGDTVYTVVLTRK